MLNPNSWDSWEHATRGAHAVKFSILFKQWEETHDSEEDGELSVKLWYLAGQDFSRQAVSIISELVS